MSLFKSGKENMAPSRAKGKAVAEEDVRDGSFTGEFFLSLPIFRLRCSWLVILEMSDDEEPKKSATKSKGKRPLLQESESNEEGVKELKKRLANVGIHLC